MGELIECKRYADREYYEKKILYHRMIVELASNEIQKVHERMCTEVNILDLDILKEIVKNNQAELDRYKDLREKQQKKEAQGDGEEG